jgi:hypothetical protein
MIFSVRLNKSMKTLAIRCVYATMILGSLNLSYKNVYDYIFVVLSPIMQVIFCVTGDDNNVAGVE